MNELHNYIINDRSLRKNTKGKSEVQIQTELRPVIIDFLKKWFKEEGVVDYEGKAHDAFYWEGQEGRNKSKRNGTFGAFNYPDFVIKKPYNIAVEYKQSQNGSTVKQGIGQSVMHTMSEDYDYVYYLFRDQSGGKIEESRNRRPEQKILGTLWKDFNVKLEII